MRAREIDPTYLTEVMWEERYSVMKTLRKYPNAWVHFSEIPKLGINPKKSHRDPPGIYFYPVNWLLRYEASISQYATHYPYFFVCDIKRTPNIVSLNRMTSAMVDKIATRNGWIDDLNRIKSHLELLADKGQPMEKRLLRKPGGLFYAAMDYLANIEHRSWLQMLRGIDAIVDTGSGIISPHETHQMCVLNKRIIAVLEFDHNRDEFYSVYGDIMKKVAEQLGGTFYYRNKLPQADVVIDGKPIHATLDVGNYVLYLEYNKDGFWVQKREKYANHDTGDVASEVRDLKFWISRAADDATVGPPRARYWNAVRIKQLANLITGLPIRYSRVEDGAATYSTIWNNTVSGYLHIVVHDNDKITVKAELGFRHERLAEVTRHGSTNGTDPKILADAVLEALAASLRKNAQPGMKIPAIAQLSHFQFGDRFSEAVT